MKAIRIHQTCSFEQLKHEEVDPPIPEGDEVLIKVISASVNFADVMTRKGTYPMIPPLPAIPGIVKSAGVRTFMLPSIFELDPVLMARSADILFNDLADNKIKPHIYERIPLAEAARAHELLESGKVQGKLILKP